MGWRVLLVLALALGHGPTAEGCQWFRWLSPKGWVQAAYDRFFSVPVPATAPPPLLAAGEHADARFLVQKKYGYSDNADFVQPMGRAIDTAAAGMREAIASGKDITPDQVWAWMDGIAATRAEVARTLGQEGPYGRPLPRRAEDHSPKYLSQSYQEDRLSPDTEGQLVRHLPFYDQAFKTAVAARRAGGYAKDSPWRTMTVFGEPFRRSSALELGDRLVLIMHPTYAESIPMMDKAVNELARALNNPNITEKEFVEVLAQSHTLFMHATPYNLGSPSIVEAYFDAALRAKFGKTLGRKTDEPFWRITLAPPERAVLTGDEFLRLFGGGAP